MSVDQDVCQYCGEKNPGSFLKNNFILRSLDNPDFVKKSIIGINIILFILTLAVSLRGVSFSMNPLNFLSPDNRALLAFGAGGRIPVDRYGIWWSFLTAGYLHGSILHLFFNMAAFSQLFTIAVNFFGIKRSFTIYTIAGIAGFIASYISGTQLTIGASASICGLIGACFYYGKSRGGLYGNIVYKQVSGWVVSLIVFGLFIPGIDNFAHFGGFAGGALTAFLLGYLEKKPRNSFDTIIGAGMLFITIILLYKALSTGLKIFLLN